MPYWQPVEIERSEYERADEPMGTKEKFWVRLPGEDRLWLFKLARDRDGIVRGEDWAEWLVHNLATLIGIPTATVRPASLAGRRGIVSRNVLGSPVEELVHGNSVLGGRYPDYDQSIQRQNPGYTPDAVRAALDGVSAPRGWPELAAFSGYQVWAGYLLLDAWVSGRDRHHQNWAIIRTGASRWLSASFDHGNAMGFAERDARREHLLAHPERFMRWLDRGRSHHFAGKPTLVGVASRALSLAGSDAADYWLTALGGIDEQAVRHVIDSVPEEVMSEVTRRFVIQLLETNRRRVLDGNRSALSR